MPFFTAFGLNPGDLRIIRTNDMLTDKHITAVNTLLQAQFPHIDGLHPPMSSRSDLTEKAMRYPRANIKKDYVQILNTGGLHWVTSIVQKGKHCQLKPFSICLL